MLGLDLILRTDPQQPGKGSITISIEPSSLRVILILYLPIFIFMSSTP